MPLRLPRAAALFFLTGLVACTAVPPHPLPPPPPHPHPLPLPPPFPFAPPPPPPPPPFHADCTGLPLPDGFETPPDVAHARRDLLADADRILAGLLTRDDAPGRVFTRARALLETNRWPEATRAFGEVAFVYPHEDVGIGSAMLYLQGLNVLGSLQHPGSACFDEMADGIPVLQSLYCENGKARRHPQECYQFYKVERNMQRPHCTLREPPKEPLEVLYARAGATQLVMAARCLEFTLPAGVSPIQDHCDDFAFYAAVAFLHVPDYANAEKARALLLEPKNGMLKSPRVEELGKRWK